MGTGINTHKIIGCIFAPIVALLLSQTTVLADDPFTCEPPLECPTPVSITDYELDADSDINGFLDDSRQFFSNGISKTLELSATIHTSIVAEDVISTSIVPDSYAPTMPRAIAQIGWQFEAMNSDLQRRYSLSEWTTFVASIIVVPVKLVKSLFVLGRYLGPLGLFLGWLFVMLPLTLLMKMSKFMKDLVTSLFNFLIDIIRFVLDVIKLIPGL